MDKAINENQTTNTCKRKISNWINKAQEKVKGKQTIMNEKKNDVICIIGMHRSGTSMIARLLNLCGLDLGPPEQLVVPNEFNPPGYFENKNFSLIYITIRSKRTTWLVKQNTNISSN